jgi:myo-inositol-1(or 4)-monophosphatase
MESIISVDLLQEMMFLRSATGAGVEELMKKRRNLSGLRKETKPNDFWESWVSEADEASQRAIIAELRRNFPKDVIIAEEGDTIIKCRNRPYIFIDPLDGTVHFLRGEDNFAVTVSRYTAGRKVGFIIRPMFGDCFMGVIDGKNDCSVRFFGDESEPLRVSGTVSPVGAKILVCQPDKYVALADALKSAGFEVQRGGPCTFASIAVASGTADGYVAPGGFGADGRKHPNMKWDFGAGDPLVVAAGGWTGKISGEELGLEHSSFLAVNGSPLIRERLIETLLPFTPDNNFGL